ncbi:MAG TPA: hypothetical protein DCQ64_02505 [Candidatus Rokubacteria bacterium]|nr:hypothetical protein [Candidatus Rokubacteria bacterium]
MLEADLVNTCRLAAERMGCFLAVVGQRNASKSGSTLGFPDLVLLCAGQVRLIEVKRAKTADDPAGTLNLGQIAFIQRAAEQHVPVDVIDSLDDFMHIANSCRMARGVRRRV